ncbi:hypothetical protein GEV33_008172 [Tenebrio molitor]|uniref:Uncharacterized protein n=1 Tax=Tenebrio molitor TaxID=7067 RepID=A0A8J6HH99_TENMO|nr:hypothetical protein GEV33_008172 [Tenebrio molitor]
MQGNMQYVFHDVCHIQIITYFDGWCTVLETLGPWCLPDKKLVVPREKLERQRLKMLFFSSLMTTVEEVYLKNYIYREPINILEELNDQIYETLATVIPNMLRLARENLIKRTRLFLQMKSGHSTEPSGWCAVSSPGGKFESALFPTPFGQAFGPDAKARDVIHFHLSEAFPLPKFNINSYDFQANFIACLFEVPSEGLLSSSSESSVDPVSPPPLPHPRTIGQGQDPQRPLSADSNRRPASQHIFRVNTGVILRKMAVTIYREIRADSPTHYRNNIREFPEKKRSSAEIEDSVGDRRAGGCAASREMRITCVAVGIRNHPRERIADRHGAYRPACQVSGAVREPEEFTELPIYRLPFTDYRYRETPRDLERYRGSSIKYRTAREYRKVLLQNLPWSTPFQRKGVVRIAAGVPYRRSSS